MTNEWVDLCAVSDVPEGGALRVTKGPLLVAVFNVEGAYYVTDDTCTHGPGSLSAGFVMGDVVECDFHAGCFHIPTGRVTAPPCMVPVNTYATEVRDGRVWIDPAPRVAEG